MPGEYCSKITAGKPANELVDEIDREIRKLKYHAGLLKKPVERPGAT